MRSTFRTSITIGTIATTRLSTAPVSQVVQPRFDPPATTNLLTGNSPPASLAITAVIVSIARTALLTIGLRAGQVGSPVLKYWIHVYATRSSSTRDLPSP